MGKWGEFFLTYCLKFYIKRNDAFRNQVLRDHQMVSITLQHLPITTTHRPQFLMETVLVRHIILPFMLMDHRLNSTHTLQMDTMETGQMVTVEMLNICREVLLRLVSSFSFILGIHSATLYSM